MGRGRVCNRRQIQLRGQTLMKADTSDGVLDKSNKADKCTILWCVYHGCRIITTCHSDDKVSLLTPCIYCITPTIPQIDLQVMV